MNNQNERSRLFIAVQKGHSLDSRTKIIDPKHIDRYKNWGWYKLTSLSRKKRFLKKVELEGDKVNYTLFEDGTIYSSYKKGFLKIQRQTGKSGLDHFYYRMRIGNEEKSFYLLRLIYFYFCEHKYSNIDELPHIITIDNNPGNINPNNLKTVTNVIDKNIERKGSWSKNPHLSEENKEESFKKIRIMILEGKKMDWIATQFNTSHSSIKRFLRNKIGISRDEILNQIWQMKNMLSHRKSYYHETKIREEIYEKFQITKKELKNIRKIHKF